tara:strand:+ start:22702 stop:23958 length:1257 start_codon:yes stop_codon:yes gene_type:complete
MNNIESIAQYSKKFSNHELHSHIINNHLEIEAWFRKQWIKYPAPFYSSIDLRNSGYKMAPVDTNLFPAGFNNLDESLESLYISAIQHTLEKQSVDITRILIITENHTRNKFYIKSSEVLERLIRKAGFETKSCTLGDINDLNQTNQKLTKKNSLLSYGSFIPDIILLNNDLSAGVPEILKKIKQLILPDLNMGWTNRSKTVHFKFYSDIIYNFSRVFNIDSWLLEPLFRNCGEIDFKTKRGEECIVYHATKLFKLIEEKYDEYAINEKPYLMIKADSGTYGMGIIQVKSIDDIITINRKQRTKMTKTKGGNTLNSVILQEGIYSNEKLSSPNEVVEPVIYSFGSNLVGGFYRVHQDKNNSENLNSPGMTFKPIPFNNVCISPDHTQSIYSDTNKFYIYGVVARLAILAAAKELYNVEI